MPQPDSTKDFNSLAVEVSPALLSYLRRYVGNASLAEDLLQETLIRMEKGLADFEQRSSVRTWAFTIASRVAADYFRRPENRLDIIDIDEAGDVADEAPPITQSLMVAEMGACVRQVIDSLPAEYRTALVLHDLEGLTAEQVASICGCSASSAKIRIHRARSRLKQKLETRCDFLRDVDGIFRCDQKR